MKKLLRNKKMFLTLIAGLFVFVAVLGAGTFAWFTGKATTDLDGTITAALVGVTAEEFMYGVFDFHGNSLFGGAYQAAIEALWGTADADTVFTDLIRGAGYAKETGLVLTMVKEGIKFDDPTDVNYKKLFAIGLIFNAFTKEVATPGGKSVPVVNLTPGSLIVTKFSFSVKDDATIPVYFRVQAAEKVAWKGNDAIPYSDIPTQDVMVATLIGTPTDPAAVVAATLANYTVADQGVVSVVAELLGVDHDGDGNVDWYYCNLPLSPLYAWQVDLTDITYLYGRDDAYVNIDPNDLQGAVIGFVNAIDGSNTAVVEVIQGTNNAVNLAPEWADAAAFTSIQYGGLFFLPYFTDAFDMYKAYQDFWAN